MTSKAVKFEQFNPQTDNWQNYLDRLSFCFEANGVSEDGAKRANFLSLCGARVFETLLALITPRKASDVTFVEIQTVLTRHYCPKPNEISMSFKFYKCNQSRDESADEQKDSLNGVYCVQPASSSSRVPPYEVEVSLAGTPVRMQVDTGAGFSILNEVTWRAVRPRLPRDALRPARLTLRTWTETPVRLLGQAKLPERHRLHTCDLTVIVAKGNGPNLLGRDWLAPLNISMSINFISKADDQELNHVMAKHKEVFKEGLGTYRGHPVAIHLKEGATPKFLKARPVPYAIKERVEKEIDRLH